MYLFQTVLDTNYKHYVFLSETLLQDQVENIIENKKKWEWLSYLLIILVQSTKILIISFLIQLGVSLFNMNLKFKKTFYLVTKAEFIFVFVSLVKMIILYFKGNYTFEDILYFYPLSALHFVGYEGLSPWFIYPLQTLNLFEVFYWFVLAFYLAKELKKPIDFGFKIIASSYGSSLIIWVVTVMFISLSVN